MLTAAKEGTFSASTDPCVLFPLAASSRLYLKTRVWGSKPENVHCSSAIGPLKIELRWGCEESSGKNAVGSGVSYKYDPFGRRSEKISPTATSIFSYDGDNLVETVNASGGVVARYAQDLNIDAPLAMLRGSTTDYYEADGLGSITSLTDTTGALAATNTYDSFGNTVASTGTLRDYFQYTGREFDTETGLYFYRTRYYDPDLGRFMGEDSQRFEAGVNFYVYALENPILFIDPFGLDIWLEGPSGNEPAGHLSINVGNPNGSYSSYSFGVDGNGLEGMVYQDTSLGGNFYPGYYLHTTPAEDALAKAHLDSLLGNKAGYRPWNTCRTFSFNQFKYFQDKKFGKPGPPPPRAKNPRNPSFNVPWYSSTTATDPAPSSSTPASSNRK
jgi:RHS repeat-associated protein